MKERRYLEKIEESILAPYAKKSARGERLIKIGAEGRVFDYRTEFQRDRDRIIYSKAFRRLRNKARIGQDSDKDHRRDAFLHTMEVSQLARTIGRVLRLNEDLIEAISLGHDLGLPPFGKAGEKALDVILRRPFAKIFKVKGKTTFSGFQRNRQSLRVVDSLEKRYVHNGINLTHDTRDGILKQGEWNKNKAGIPIISKGLDLSLAPSFEAQCVRIADRIAVSVENLDDGITAGEIDLAEVERLPLVKELIKKIGRRYSSLKNRYMKVNSLNRGLNHLLVTNVIHYSSQFLKRWVEKHQVDSTERFYETTDAVDGSEIDFSNRVRELFFDFSEFVSKRMTRSLRAKRAEAQVRHMIQSLFKAYYADPLILEDYLLLRYREWNGVIFLRDFPEEQVREEISRNYHGKNSFINLICDHVAGMTDSYASQEFQRLCRPKYQID
jgi:dGTPase